MLDEDLFNDLKTGGAKTPSGNSEASKETIEGLKVYIRELRQTIVMDGHAILDAEHETGSARGWAAFWASMFFSLAFAVATLSAVLVMKGVH